jgi:hypothetical protein
MEDNLLTEDDVKEYQKRSYDDLSSEFQRLYPRVIRLIPLMYNRLTLVDKLSHKEAITKIYNDHRDLPGFSRRNICRDLPLDNATVPRRIRPSRPKNSIIESEAIPTSEEAIPTSKEAIVKIYNDHRDLPGFSRRNICRDLPLDNATVPRRIRPSRPKNSTIESEEAPELSGTIHEQNQNVQTIASNNSKTTTNPLDESLTEVEITGYNINPDLLIIPKEKYPDLEEAMQKSRSSVCVVFDKSGMLERVVPDIFRGK